MTPPKSNSIRYGVTSAACSLASSMTMLAMSSGLNRYTFVSALIASFVSGTACFVSVPISES